MPSLGSAGCQEIEGPGPWAQGRPPPKAGTAKAGGREGQGALPPALQQGAICDFHLEIALSLECSRPQGDPFLSAACKAS